MRQMQQRKLAWANLAGYEFFIYGLKIVVAPTPLHLKNKLLGYIDLQEEFDTPPLKPTKTTWAQFQQAQLTPYKSRLHFLAHL